MVTNALLFVGLLVGAVDRFDPEDQAIYDKAMSAPRQKKIDRLEAEIAEYKQGVHDHVRKSDPLWVNKKQAELKKAKAKPKEIAQPSVLNWRTLQPGQVGVLFWPSGAGPTFTVKQAVGKDSILVASYETEKQYAIATAYKHPTVSGFAPSVQIGKTDRPGPDFLITGLDSLPSVGNEYWCRFNVFLIEPQRSVNGQEVTVLRQLHIKAIKPPTPNRQSPKKPGHP